MMSKNELRDQIIALLADSGLEFREKVKAMTEARVAIQPRASESDWRKKAQPILKPKDKGK